jgi:hypothetical protein
MYKIIKNSAGKFDLIELATEQVVGVFDDHGAAKKQYNRFKGGVAFNGWTPSFFLINVMEYTK